YVTSHPKVMQPPLGTPDGTRPHTGSILSRLPLPIGLRGRGAKVSYCAGLHRSDWPGDYLFRPIKDGVEHLYRQRAGLGIALADVIAAKQNHGLSVARVQQRLRAVAKLRLRAWHLPAQRPRRTQYRTPGKRPQRENHLQPRRHKIQFAVQPMAASIALLGAGLVLGWGAAHG